MTTTDTIAEITDEMTYHRNGVGGCGFYVRADERGLVVAFSEYAAATETWGPGAELTVPMAVLARFPDEPVREDTIRPAHGYSDDRSLGLVAVLADSDPTVIIWDQMNGSEDARYVAVIPAGGLDHEDGCKVAVFDLDLVLAYDVRFGYNSHRGDVHLYDVRDWLPGGAR
jgi:hypothetical protein